MKRLLLMIVFVLGLSAVCLAQKAPVKALDGSKPASAVRRPISSPDDGEDILLGRKIPMPTGAIPAAPIPVPEPEAAALKASVEEYQQKLRALDAQYQPQWKLILARAALRARLTIEQSDALVVTPVLDEKGNVTGYTWSPPKEKQ